MVKVVLDWDKKLKKGIICSDFLSNIRAKISIKNETAIYSANKFSPKFISPISTTGRFSIGLYFELINQLKNDDIDYNIITTKLLSDKLIQRYEWADNYKISQLSLDLRDYQEESIKRSINIGYGINEIATAGGKTLIMASLIQTIRNNQKQKFTTLVILPSNILTQTHEEFLNYGIDRDILSVWGGGEEFNKKPIILISAETLKSSLNVFPIRKPKNKFQWQNSKTKKEDTYEEYVKNFTDKEKQRKNNWNKKRKFILNELSDTDLMIIDEVHGLRKDNVLVKAVDKFDTMHRFGFTGTLPQDLIDQWSVIGTIGPVITRVKSSVLRDKKFISQVTIKGIMIHHRDARLINSTIPDSDNTPTRAFNNECEYLHKSTYRNNVISHLVDNFDKNVLVLVNKLDHGEMIKENLMKNSNKKIFFIRGSVEMEDREKLRKLMEKEDNIVCIAMDRIFATGINIKNLHYIILTQGGKAKVTLIQSIGRGLRLHENKHQLIIIDIADNLHYSKIHLAERLKYYKDEKISYTLKNLYEK